MEEHRVALRFLLPSTLVAAALACACTGTVRDNPLRPPAADDPYGSGASAVGHVTLRRLNRYEYNRTVRSLLGVAAAPADAFPPDNKPSANGRGFDNIGSALSVSTAHADAYVDAAEALVEEAFAGPQTRARWMSCVPSGADECARAVVREFASRAWRRPALDAEVDDLVQTFVPLAMNEGDPPEVGLKLAFQAILLSPHFLYLVETAPTGTSAQPLSDYELATRLSYFLWSAPPDDALLDRAEAGELRDAAVVRQEAERMLSDPRAEALVENFAAQWFTTRALDGLVGDGLVAADLAEAMQRETLELFRTVLVDELPVVRLVDADFTYVNPRLAAHYAIAPVTGWQEVDGAARRSAGVLTHGSWLTLTSSAERTSPVFRGKWLADRLLCIVPAEPPAAVGELRDDTGRGTTLRDVLEEHRANPACAGCHNIMDPLGLAVERYDNFGVLRDSYDDGDAIDERTAWFGVQMEGVAGLSDLMVRASEARAGLSDSGPLQSADFVRCSAQTMLTYALGREVSDVADHHWIDEVQSEALDEGGTLRAMVLAIVTSDVFRKQQAETEGDR